MQIDLIGESQEARNFCLAARADIGRYLLFPEERFMRIDMGIAATEEVDLQNEAIPPESLEELAAHMNSTLVWLMREHNPLLGIIGRVLTAGRFYAPQSGIYFVAVVNGLYDLNLLPTFEEFGVDVLPPIEIAYGRPEPERTAEARLACSPHEIPDDVVAEMLEQAPECVAREPTLKVRKNADPVPILTVLASFWLATSNPFSKKFLECCGEKGAEEAIAFYSWLKDGIIAKVAQLAPKKLLFVLETPYKGCRVEFVTASTDPAVLIEAVQCRPDAVQAATALVDKLEYLGIQKLIYAYHLPTKKWLPLHAATRWGGVIANRAALIVLDQFGQAAKPDAPSSGGLSIGS